MIRSDNMMLALSGRISFAGSRSMMESSRQLSWVREGTATVRASEQNNTVKCEESVKLLGVTVDYMLNFDSHISDICKKAARQINVLCRLKH